MNLKTLINAHQYRFSETEREILAFMLENERFVAESTISSLAHKTFTSTSSIIRLTKKLEFSGFAELKYFIKNSLNDAPPPLSDFVDAGRRDIEETLQRLEGIDLTPILEKVHGCRTLYCFGTGYAQRNAIHEFAKSMLACGKFSHVIPAKNEFAGSISVMSNEDLVILVSLSGNTESIKETVKLLSVRKIPMIAITASGVNYLASTADYSLYYESTPTRLPGHQTPYHSFVALNILLDFMVRKYIEFIDQEEES